MIITVILVLLKPTIAIHQKQNNKNDKFLLVANILLKLLLVSDPLIVATTMVYLVLGFNFEKVTATELFLFLATFFSLK